MTTEQPEDNPPRPTQAEPDPADAEPACPPDAQALRYGEAKIMEPLYRMYKVLAPYDAQKAQTLLAVATQYIVEHYRGRTLRPAEVQQLLRSLLLQESDGSYYAAYACNELQVAAAEWLTLSAADLPITLEQLGKLAEDFARSLEGQDFIRLTAEDALQRLENLAAEMDPTLAERLRLNRAHYLAQLRNFLLA